MRGFVREVGRYYLEMNRYSIWVFWITAAIGLVLLAITVFLPYTALIHSNPALALDLIGQCREAGFGVLAVGLVLSCIGDVIVKYDHIEV